VPNSAAFEEELRGLLLQDFQEHWPDWFVVPFKIVLAATEMESRQPSDPNRSSQAHGQKLTSGDIQAAWAKMLQREGRL
jgi:hypothetical protein